MDNQGVSELVRRAIGGAEEGRPVELPDEVAALFRIPTFSLDSAALIAAARRLSERACGGRAEVHGQMSVNVGPCPRDCLFCAFAKCNEVFSEQHEFPIDDVVARACQLESEGANAVFLMATGVFPFKRFLEHAAAARAALRPETTLIANVGDFGVDQARLLKQAGFAGVYHAVRLGEGEVTRIPIEKRLATFRAVHEAGLGLGTCLEPVGPEHTAEELAEKLLITRDARPVYSGSARRIVIPSTELAPLGQVSEARMAHILAVCRIVLPLSIPGICTHEPNALGAAAGANLFWAEVGANPRDTTERTEDGRGMTVPRCQAIMQEAEWKVFDGPSRFYGKRAGDPPARLPELAFSSSSSSAPAHRQ
jgi:biotin synthase